MLRNSAKRLDEGTRQRRKRQYLESLEYDNANGSLQFDISKFNSGRSEKIYLKRSTRSARRGGGGGGSSKKSKYKEASDSDTEKSSEEEIDELDSQTENTEMNKKPEKSDDSQNKSLDVSKNQPINTTFLPIPNSEHHKSTQFNRKSLKERIKDDHILRSTENVEALLNNMENNVKASRVAKLLLNQDQQYSYREPSYHQSSLAPKSKKAKTLKPCMVCGNLKSPYNCIICGFLICSVNCKNTHNETRCEKFMR